MCEKREGRRVNRTELSEIFGVAKTTVDSWVQRGCPAAPSLGRGRERMFNTAQVAAWLEEEAKHKARQAPGADKTELSLRKLAAEVRLAENELKRQMAAVAPVEEMERAWKLQKEVIRRCILEIPERVHSQLLGETDEARFKATLNAEMVKALQKAADADIDLDTSDAS